MSWKREKILVENALRVQFYGPAVDQHQMDVHDLAQSLLGIESAYRLVYAALFGENRAAPRLGLSDVDEGSFIYDVTVMQDFAGLWDVAKEFFNGDDLQAMKNAAEAGGTLLGVLAGIRFVVKKARGRNGGSALERVVDAIADAGQQESTPHQDEVLKKMDEILHKIGETRSDFDPQAARSRLDALTGSKAFVNATKKTLSPLAKRGYESISLTGPAGGGEPVRIEHDDYSDLDLAIEEEEIETEVFKTTVDLKFDQVKFSSGSRTFTFSANGVPLKAKILDEVFRERLANGLQRIGANDTIRVILRTTMEHLPGGPTTRHEILQVLEVNAYEPVEEDVLPFDPS